MDLDLDDFVEDVGLPGLVIGVGVLAIAPFFGPALAKVGKPLAKATVKGGILAYEKGKYVFAEASDTLKQVIAESKAELENPGREKAIDSVKTVSISSSPVDE